MEEIETQEIFFFHNLFVLLPQTLFTGVIPKSLPVLLTEPVLR